ncbi:MAG: hypothetical protein E4H02_11625 [Lentisphaerales bacterium]|nr:MAG: hypothetical protein E4H02_11625 [Lentisphaerales bacterium]
MKAMAGILIIVVTAPLLCSCSAVFAGRYVVPSSLEGATERPYDTWRTYGAAPRGAGAPRRETIEWSFGTERPAVYERHFNEELSYVIYPTIVSERVLLVGPPFLPVIPTFFVNSPEADPYMVRIVWRGNIEKAKGINVDYVTQRSRYEGIRSIANRSKEQMECKYVFENKLTDKSELFLSEQGGTRIVRIPLRYQRGIEWFPYIRFLNASTNEWVPGDEVHPKLHTD